MVTKMIVLWYGNPANVPVGWQVCDGTNGTPDLRDRFAAGASSWATVPKTEITGTPQATGGTVDHAHEMDTSTMFVDASPAGQYDKSTSSAQHIPPFVAVFYIMKVLP